ncbi:MAG: radical SAM protein [Candidatus Falkowbacteria bacterium]
MEKSVKEYFGLGSVPVGIGAVLKGWDFTSEEFKDKNRLSVVDFRAMAPICYHNCFHCFTDKSAKSLKISEIKRVISEIVEMKGRSINFLGEGEPTLDPNFFEIIIFASLLGVTPIVFTDGATRLRNPEFVKRLKSYGVSICLKCDSIFNEDYQNWVVRDRHDKYFSQRNDSLRLLMKEGFNEKLSDGNTRLGFDMVVSTRNIAEVPETLRFCRQHNIWVVFASYLPAGRSGQGSFDKKLTPSAEQLRKMRQLIYQIDKEEFGFDHHIWNNFATTPCVERLQIYGDGRVSPCPGNEKIIGNVRINSIKSLHEKILKEFPCHDPELFSGNCPYRPK